MKISFWVWLVVLCALASCRREPSVSLVNDSVDFNLHIRPILSDRCFKCHGPDANQRKANLRLDMRENALAALKDNPRAHAIVPGNSAESEVFRRISSVDTAEVMPPANSNLSLNSEEIALIAKWIDQGAKYKRHWAFIPPQKAQLPQANGDDWPSNEIDHFILTKMDAAGLSPNEEADKERLLKRVSLDITGLPPDINMQEEFVNDGRADAYEKIVDKLLARPQYGEKMAVYWMDIARYADSHGYQDDGYRTMWPLARLGDSRV